MTSGWLSLVSVLHWVNRSSYWSWLPYWCLHPVRFVLALVRATAAICCRSWHTSPAYVVAPPTQRFHSFPLADKSKHCPCGVAHWLKQLSVTDDLNRWSVFTTLLFLYRHRPTPFFESGNWSRSLYSASTCQSTFLLIQSISHVSGRKISFPRNYS